MHTNDSSPVSSPGLVREATLPSPKRLLATLAAMIFVAEIFAMIVLYFLEIPDYAIFSLLDGVLMISLILPGLYFLQLKPLVIQMEERERAERSLRSNEELLRRVLELLPIGVWIIDGTGKIAQSNRASRQIWDGQELVGLEPNQVFQDLGANSSGPGKPEEWATPGAIQRGETSLQEEIEIEASDGSQKIILNSVIPFPEEGGAARGAVVVSHDITERRFAERKIALQNEELRALYESESTARRFAETLSAASQALTESLELDHVINTLLEHTCKIVPTDTAVVTLLEDESRLTVCAMRTPGGGFKPVDIPFTPIDSITDSVVQRLRDSHRSMVIPNTPGRYEGGQALYLEQITHWLVLPIIASGKVIGLVELGQGGGYEIGAVQTSWAEAIVSQAAVALQNAWLFEQVRSSKERLQSLAHRLVEIQENEREYVARELHDEAGQALSSLKLGLGRLEQNQGCSLEVKERLHELKDVVDSVLEELHRMAMDLRPVALDHLGLVAALEQYVDHLNSEQLTAQFKAVGFNGSRLPRDVETSIYRIVQEALTNMLRHAGASQVGVLLEWREVLKVFIEDDGVGFVPTQVDLADHMGLLGMRERAEMMGGNLLIESAPGAGTSIIVEVPYANSNSDR